MKTYKLYKYGKRLSLDQIKSLLYDIGFVTQENFVPYESVKHGAVLDTYSVEELPDSIEAKEVKKWKELWDEFADIPIKNDCIDEPFLHFEVGTDRFEIWGWFEETYDICLGEELENSNVNC